MKCIRCTGFLLNERFIDRMDMSSFLGFRCVNCGDIIDPMIIANRETILPASSLRAAGDAIGIRPGTIRWDEERCSPLSRAM